jgi:threonine/homoserine/homoserine lactone efflux protein
VFASVLGLSAILATSAVAFTVVKWVGAAYLVWIGIQALTRSAPVDVESTSTSGLSLTTIFWQGFFSDVLNPKVALFFLAFLPQFVTHGHGDEWIQLLVLGVTGNVIAIGTNLLLVCFASAATASLRRSQRITRWLHRAVGAMFIALGLRLANEKL